MISFCYYDVRKSESQMLNISDRRCEEKKKRKRRRWGGILIYFIKRKRGHRKYRWNEYERIRKLTEAFIRLNENAPYGQGAGQTNKSLKINLTNYCLSHLRVSPAWLGTQSKGADAEKSWGGRRVTTSCLGNYHHFWHELRGPSIVSLLLLNSLHWWLMMKREHAPTPLMGLWHNVLCIPCDPCQLGRLNTTHTGEIVWTTTGGWL